MSLVTTTKPRSASLRRKREAEQKINDIQRTRQDANQGQRFVLTPEQQAELEKAQGNQQGSGQRSKGNEAQPEEGRRFAAESPPVGQHCR